MTTKRIRCACGRVYDPVKRSACPDCGSVSPVAAPTAKPEASPPPLPQSSPPNSTRSALPLNPRTIAIGVGVVMLLLIVIALSRCGGADKSSTAKQQAPSPPPTATVAPTIVPTPAPAIPTAAPVIPTIPPVAPTPPLQAGPAVMPSTDLPALIAKAAPGATVKIPPGLYPGGLILERGVRLVGGSGVVIQGDGRECISVRAPGVSVQGVQFMCNGIGELPAISVADGAELDLDACHIQTTTLIGIGLSGQASLKAIGCTLTAVNGAGLRVLGGKANLTQCTFSDSNVAISVWKGAAAELQSCAFQRNGAGDGGGIMSVNGEGASVNAKDCHFNGNSGAIFVNDSGVFNATDSSFKGNGDVDNMSKAIGLIAVRKNARVKIDHSFFEENRQGIAVGALGHLELEECTMSGNGSGDTRQAVLITVPVSVGGEGAQASLHKTSLRNSAQIAAFVLAGGNLVLDDVEISGARTAGLVVGDANAGPGRAKIIRARFQRNGTAIGVFTGSTLEFEDSECRENDDGIMAGDRGTEVTLKNSKFLGQRDHGLVIYGQGKAKAIGCEFRGNARGAQSGMPRKTSGPALLTLENCATGENRVFGVGAFSKNELILVGAKFDGTDRTNIFKERNATVQNDSVVEPTPTPSPSASPGEAAPPAESVSPTASPSPRKERPKTKKRARRGEDDAARVLRRLFGPF